MGPILICVDTSGSMQRGAEDVAKAVVLEAMRAAHAQHRRCHVFAFGGPDELIEMELAVDSGGIDASFDFWGKRFVAVPISAAPWNGSSPNSKTSIGSWPIF